MDRNPLWYVWNLRRQGVALRKESVDRNPGALRATENQNPSLSARRAWIEICLHCVDEVSGDSRSPQGERG